MVKCFLHLQLKEVELVQLVPDLCNCLLLLFAILDGQILLRVLQLHNLGL